MSSHFHHLPPSYTPTRLALTLQALPDPAKGVVLALLSTALFVVVGVLVKILTETVDVFQILLFRQLIFVTMLLPAIYKNRQVLTKFTHIRLHSFRILGAFIALYGGFVTISNMPLADATALGFTQVLFVAVISKIFLSEQINRRRIITIMLGFIGVMLVVQPNFEHASISYTLVGLFAALGAAIAATCVRKMAQTVPRIVLLTYQAVFVGLIALIPSLLSWQWPNLNEMMLLLLVGIISSVAQWVGVTAYRWGEANVIANVEYAKIVYSILLGYLIFTEMPNTLAILGVTVILISSVIPLYLKAQTK